MNVRIVLSRCRHSRKPFGVRMEEMQRNVWSANWAFGLTEGTAKREGYGKSEIAGSFGIADNYPGCPTCQDTGLLKCACGRVSCYDGTSKTLICPWCNKQGNVGGNIDRLTSGTDY